MTPRPSLLRFDHGITAVDTDYMRPLLDASHILVRGGRAAFVDTGTTHSVPLLLAALGELGVDAAAVDWVFLTHIHLDHAGGAGELMKHLPNAKVVVHPRGAGHIAHPEKLIAGTIAVYGEAEFRRLYGDIPGIPADRIVQAADGMTLRLGGSELTLIHTPGHALHHYCIVDQVSEGVFTGDTFGISYRVFDTVKGPFIFPATTPVHFDPIQAHASLDRIMSYAPKAVYLTHYSRVGNPELLAKDMRARLDEFVRMAEQLKDAGEARLEKLKRKLHAYLVKCVREHGCTLDQATVDTWLEMDVDLNAKGLLVWLDRR
ncbi:MAG TPA: MBL fold metallo-hydrolase [Gammaproteobacteria bacterium]|jgi:glyoxylase-like metal-dependent hydrolase (beta-lactamase superfamily II)|nr:MBL fold metallo-hydrolase [Gammaproteobacteria bacterium]